MGSCLTRLGAMTIQRSAARRSGVWFGLAAYGIWGLFPLYWPFLKPASAMEILAHRIFWTFVLMALIVTVRRAWPAVAAVFGDRRRLGLMIAAAVLIATNWGVYIWAVNVNRVVDASLGYFINPLVSVVFGVIFLRERLRPLVWLALGIGVVAILVMVWANGTVPWIGLTLAFSFGTYALVRKLADVQSYIGLTVEGIILTPLAVSFLFVLGVRGTLVFGHHSINQSVFSMLAGPITAVPLLFFGAAVTRVDLSTMGLLQYVTPSAQFLLGLWVFHEQVSLGRWLGFVIVWLALGVFTFDNIRHSTSQGDVVLIE